jgi:ubiquinone/menaquinone biosynthesis C-methylase UbiE
VIAEQAEMRSGGQAEIRLQCPGCGAATGTLPEVESSGMACAACGFLLEKRGGIVCALLPRRKKELERFLEEYSRIRKAEGRGSTDAAYYLALPYRDTTGRNSGQWSVRRTSYAFLKKKVLPRFEAGHSLRILDLGAGTGWLSFRLARRGHCPVAVDILTDSSDGLGAARHYEAELGTLFPLVAAEFDNLPFAGGQFDLAVFNSSLHYSTDYARTLSEARRCLKPTGKVIVLDSPIYARREHGELMKEQRHRFFEATYGFRSDSVPSIEFLHDESLEELADALRLRWHTYRPWYGWKWHLRPWKARLKGERPPSRFHILVGSWQP